MLACRVNRLSLAFAVSLHLALGQIAPVKASTALVVNATTTVAESDSGDDLGTLQSIFQGANAPQDFSTLAPIEPLLTDLKIKRMRILQTDVYSDLDGKETFIPSPPGAWDLLTSQIDWALQHGLSLHFPVAYYMPQSFVPSGPAENWDSTVMARYKSYARQLVSYVATRSFDAGASSVIFEVSNELDLADDAPLRYMEWLAWLNQCSTSCSPSSNPVVLGFPPLGPWGRALWWINPGTFNIGFPDIWGPNGYPFQADTRRLTRGIVPMQKIFSDAVASVASDPQLMAAHRGKTIEIAGPALAGYSFLSAEDPVTHEKVSTLEEQFIDHMFNPAIAAGQFNVSKLDYISFHYYGDFRNGSYGPTTSLKYVTSRLRDKLAAVGHPETRLFLSEWGPSSDVSSNINYSHRGAAWAAAFLTDAVANKIALGSYLLMDDAVGSEASGSLAWASLAAKINNVNYPKPPANVFRMFAMMTGARRAVSGLSATNPDLGAFAATDANSAGIVVFNYNGAFADTEANAQTFSVRLEQLPFAGSTVTVRRYLIDGQTSNLQAYLTRPDQPSPYLQQVEQFTARVDYTGTLILPARKLGLGVSFWQVLL